ncbi:MAG: hypothetical protein COB73_07545, partial [Flavobacteriaceae bacterium]
LIDKLYKKLRGSYWDPERRHIENEYENISPEELKELLILSEMGSDTEAFLANLKIESTKEYCVQLMSLPEYQLC